MEKEEKKIAVQVGLQSEMTDLEEDDKDSDADMDTKAAQKYRGKAMTKTRFALIWPQSTIGKQFQTKSGCFEVCGPYAKGSTQKGNRTYILLVKPAKSDLSITFVPDQI